MEELLEMITWAQLGIHDKPVRYGFVLTTFWKTRVSKTTMMDFSAFPFFIS